MVDSIGNTWDAWDFAMPSVDTVAIFPFDSIVSTFTTSYGSYTPLPTGTYYGLFRPYSSNNPWDMNNPFLFDSTKIKIWISYTTIYNYLPLRIGNHWELASSYHDTIRESIIDTQMINGVNYYQYDRFRGNEQGVVLLRTLGDQTWAYTNPTEYLLYDFSAEAGNSWMAPEPWYDNGLGIITLVTKTDTIATNAGTFYNCIRLNHFFAMDYSYDEWFAPGVGLVQRDYLFYAFSRYSLIDYNILTVWGDVTAMNPGQFALHQNYPNPFNPVTTIEYHLPIEAPVKITVYNLAGQAVRDLVDQVQPAGIYRLYFDASTLASGLYFYRIEASGFIQTRKMVVLK